MKDTVLLVAGTLLSAACLIIGYLWGYHARDKEDDL